MKRILDSVLRRSGQLDAIVDGLMARKLRGDRPPTPAELLHAILGDLEQRVSIGPEGSLFPYNRIAITLRGDDEARRSELRATLTAATVSVRVKEHLERRSQVPADLRVEVHVTAAPAAAPYEIAVRSVPPKITVAPAAQPSTAWLLTGAGGRRFALGEGVFNIGRVDEARGRNGQLLRRNQIVVDGDAGCTVSRTHAHIEGKRNDADLLFLVYDDSPRDGVTSVIRAGRTHKVHRGTFGFRLKDGDQLCLGQARLEFRCAGRRGSGGH